MKNIYVVGTVGLPACYGGFESLVENLVTHSSSEFKYKVFCSSKTYTKQMRIYKNAELIYVPFKANGIQSIFYDIYSLFYCLFKKADVTLILGVSGCLFLPVYRLLSSSRIITNIDGLEWKREKWNPLIRKFLKFSERLAVKYSHSVIADNQAITEYVNSEYNKPAITIAYGGDNALTLNSDLFCKKTDDFYLSICRIEPENNIHLILAAFAQTNLKLKFVGNWKNSIYGQQLFDSYHNYPNIELINPTYDIDVLFDLRTTCSAYIHGHSAGGTNPSLVEAMHFNKPIFAYDCIFNRFSTENEAFYFNSTDGLIDLLSNLDDLDSTLCANKMFDIANQRYTWAVINSQYESLY